MKRAFTILVILASYLTTVAQTDLALSIKLMNEGTTIQTPLQFTNEIYKVEVTNNSSTPANNVIGFNWIIVDQGDPRDFSLYQP